MPEDVVYIVSEYGYLAIFLMVFAQEIGLPNPFPNELLLIFSGYLSYVGTLNFPFVILTVISADFLGTNLLYFLFYAMGSYILQKKPRWIPLSSTRIEKLRGRISKGGQLSICIFRLTPFTRGYTSVITGLLKVKPKIFIPIALITSLIWAAFYIIIGRLAGPYWNEFIQNLDGFKNFSITIFCVIVITFLAIYLYRRWKMN